jgi:hypothetical protein
MEQRVREAIAALVDYSWTDEKRDYAENPPDEPGRGHHIFERLVEVDNWLNGTTYTAGDHFKP